MSLMHKFHKCSTFYDMNLFVLDFKRFVDNYHIVHSPITIFTRSWDRKSGNNDDFHIEKNYTTHRLLSHKRVKSDFDLSSRLLFIFH